jgi:crotonobetainyl-CoA:carnitine CoA-transferase CaiB-like acyl-CoA transferase
MAPADPPLALDGLRVLDLGQIYNGAYTGFLLAQAGADVVKVEPPSGDNLRNRPSAHGAWYPFVALNVNKRSVCLDLKTPAGRKRFVQLAAAADVVLENFAPGVMDRLGVGYSVLREANPTLVYASSSGYGSTGRYRDRPAMDLTVQAMVGVTSVTGFPDAPPVKAGVAIADFMAGVHMYAGIVSALWRRERTGQGSCVEVAMFDAALPSLLSSLAMALGTADERPTRTGNRHGGMGEAPYNVYPTSDEGYVAIICVSDKQWVALAELIGGKRLVQDDRFATRAKRVVHIDALDDALVAYTTARTRDELIDALLAEGIPAAPVRDLREVVEDPDLRDRGVLLTVEDPDHGPLRVFSSPIRYDAREPVAPRPAPRLGEHTDEVLREWSSDAGCRGASADVHDVAGIGAAGRASS